MRDGRPILDRPLVRASAIALLLVALGGSFVLVGSIEPDPDRNRFPGAVQFADDPAAYHGDRVTVDGTVVDRDPFTIESDAGHPGTVQVTVAGAQGNPAVGDHLVVHGTLQPATGDGAVAHVDARRTIHREPWELAYMYLISLAGGLWVLGRLCNQWTFDRRSWALVPRERPLLEAMRNG